MSHKKTVGYICMLLTLLMFTLLLSVSAQQPKFFFTLHQSLRPPYAAEYGEMLALDLAKIGINLEVETIDSPTWIDKLHKAFYYGSSWEEGGMDLFVPQWGWGRYDPILTKTYIYSGFHTEMHTIDEFPGWTGCSTRWFNPRVDTLYDMAFAEPDVEKRKEYMWEVAEIMADEVPAIPVVYPKGFFAARKGITNFLPRYGAGDFKGLKNIQIEGKTLEDDVTFICATSSEWRVLYGMFCHTKQDRYVTNQFFDRLIDFDNDYNPIVPSLAKSWEISEDGTEITFHLRDDVYWHDGVKFTSADAKFTLDAALDPLTSFGNYGIIEPAQITSVEAPDDYTIVIRLPKYYAAVMIGIAYVDMIAKHQWEGIEHEDMETHEYNLEGPVIGTGPFKLVDVVPKSHVEFEANKEYFGGEPIIDKLFIRVVSETGTAFAGLETGEIDMLCDIYNYEADIERLEAHPEVTLFDFESGYTQCIGFNCQSPRLNNKWVRKAIAYMIPKEHIVNDIRKGLGVVADQIAPPYSYGYNPNVQQYEYDLEKAKECMEKAGYDMDLLETAGISLIVQLPALVGGLIVGGMIGGGIMFWRKKTK